MKFLRLWRRRTPGEPPANVVPIVPRPLRPVRLRWRWRLAAWIAGLDDRRYLLTLGGALLVGVAILGALGLAVAAALSALAA